MQDITNAVRAAQQKDRLTLMERQLQERDKEITELRDQNSQLSQENAFLRGQVEAYERVLSHIIYQNDVNTGEDSENIKEF